MKDLEKPPVIDYRKKYREYQNDLIRAYTELLHDKKEISRLLKEKIERPLPAKQRKAVKSSKGKGNLIKVSFRPRS